MLFLIENDRKREKKKEILAGVLACCERIFHWFVSLVCSQWFLFTTVFSYKKFGLSWLEKEEGGEREEREKVTRGRTHKAAEAEAGLRAHSFLHRSF